MSELIKIKNKIIQGSRQRKTLLDCYYLDDQSPKPVIVFCHGFKGFKDWGCFDLMAEHFAKRGFVFIKFNFSYNGGTIENPIDFPDLEAFSENNYTTELNDLGIVLDLLFEGNILPKDQFDESRVSLIGHSRGGGIVTLKTAEDHRIYKCVNLAAVADFGYFFNTDPRLVDECRENGVIYIENSRTHQMMPIRYQFYEDFVEHQDRLNILKNATSIKQSVLIIHGTEDSSVPLQSANALFEAIPNSKLEIIEAADHVFGAFQPYDLAQMPPHFLQWIAMAESFLLTDSIY